MKYRKNSTSHTSSVCFLFFGKETEDKLDIYFCGRRKKRKRPRVFFHPKNMGSKFEN